MPSASPRQRGSPQNAATENTALFLRPGRELSRPPGCGATAQWPARDVSGRVLQQPSPDPGAAPVR